MIDQEPTGIRRMRPRSIAKSAALWLALAPPAHAAPAFRHIVIILQENRTPDNIFGSAPQFEAGVDIASAGVDSHGRTIPLTAEKLDGCYDISHSHKAFKAMLAEGADREDIEAPKRCAVPADPQFKYVDNSTGTVQPYFDIATGYGFANRMFQTNQGPSFPAHQFMFGGTSAPRPDSPLLASENMTLYHDPAGCLGPQGQRVKTIDSRSDRGTHGAIYPCFERKTLSDLLEAANPPVSWRYYAPKPGSIWTAPDAIAHICRPRGENKARSCTGQDWLANVVPDNPAQVLTDIGNCALPAVSWVIPTGEESDHAGINTALGPQWVASIINEVGTKTCAGTRYWNDTALLVLWDDWGGWYDHVKPFALTAPPAWGGGYTYGFRVPLLVVSAYTQAGYVDNNDLDFGNILYFIEQNFGVGFIGTGKGTYGNYADYHAASRGALGEFFSLATPRGFTAIPARLGARFFIDAPKSNLAPDDD
jgi:phospholipase C